MLIHPSESVTTVEYVNIAQHQLSKAKEDWNIGNAISAYIDAKAVGDFLEARGLKMAVCLEMLKASYLQRTNKEYIITPTNRFDRAKRKLRENLTDTLTGHIEDLTEQELEMVLQHLPDLNRYPFRRALEDMCKEVGLPADDSTLSSITKIRNKLVHEFAFHPDVTLLGTPVEQFSKLKAFVGAFLMQALGYPYRGTEISWIISPDHD